MCCIRRRRRDRRIHARDMGSLVLPDELELRLVPVGIRIGRRRDVDRVGHPEQPDDMPVGGRFRHSGRSTGRRVLRVRGSTLRGRCRFRGFGGRLIRLGYCGRGGRQGVCRSGFRVILRVQRRRLSRFRRSRSRFRRGCLGARVVRIVRGVVVRPCSHGTVGSRSGGSRLCSGEAGLFHGAFMVASCRIRGELR